jgi:MarR family transcriptional regulator, transcriptional regulator for hemolysin
VDRPARTPIGLELARSARAVGRAFDDALATAGGSLPVWLVLLNLKLGANATQRELAESVGVTDATLTHHLNAMEASGLLTRRRDPGNRRVQLVEPTAAGEELFLRLRDTAVAFDRRLRRGVTAERLAELESLLGQLVANASR